MRASARSASSTPTPRSSGCATSSRARSTTSIPKRCFDLAPSVAALETRLAEDADLRRLPAKFSFVLDARGRLPLADVDADIRFEASRDGTLRCVISPATTRSPQNARPRETGEVAARLATRFLRLAGAGEDAPRRMRALVERRGANGRVRRGRARGQAAPAFARGARSLATSSARTHSAPTVVVGAAAPFGEIEAGRVRR